jgi:hypothetical protein
MPEHSLDQLRRVYDELVDLSGWADFRTPRNMALALTGRVGAVAAHLQFAGEGEPPPRGGDPRAARRTGRLPGLPRRPHRRARLRRPRRGRGPDLRRGREGPRDRGHGMSGAVRSTQRASSPVTTISPPASSTTPDQPARTTPGRSGCRTPTTPGSSEKVGDPGRPRVRGRRGRAGPRARADEPGPRAARAARLAWLHRLLTG